MKLIGVEFGNYACFENCFVPLKKGLNVLVGRNNSGKTALLHGLAVLGSLPFKGFGRSAFDKQLAGYARPVGDPPRVTLSVSFRIEEDDYSLLWHGPEAYSRNLISKQAPEIVFHFVVWPTANYPVAAFERAELVYSSNRIRILERQGEALQFLQRLPDVNGVFHESWSVETFGANEGPNNQTHPIFLPTRVFAPFAAFRNVRSIEAHRVVSAEMPLRGQETLLSDAGNLAQFWQTLVGLDRKKFQAIEDFLTRVFPEFTGINPEIKEDKVSITLTLKSNAGKIPLTHCGTGVEQLLALAAFVLTEPPGTLFLLDEPHSYLHPAAEREFMSLLAGHSEHTYVVASHSTIIINSAPPDRIVYMQPVGEQAVEGRSDASISQVFQSLGYKNSDFLFNDRLIFVEGPSDSEVFPLLLRASGLLDVGEIQRTGFPTINGKTHIRVNRGRNARHQQTPILWYERFLEQLGRAQMPRLYLLDGDWTEEDRNLLGRTKSASGEPIKLKFLTRMEIENYLLVPEAIAAAVSQCLSLLDIANDVGVRGVEEELNALLALNGDEELYPKGRGEDPKVSVKGSLVLERLFENHQLIFDKRKSGVLIAQHITPKNQPALKEIADLVAEVF